MFDKDEYWRRRNNMVEVEIKDPTSRRKNKTIKTQEPKPLRGQGDPPAPVLTEAGNLVPYTNREGKKVDTYVNAAGSHMAQVRGKLQRFNRTQSRQLLKDRTKTKVGAKHDPPKPKAEIVRPPESRLSNHQRHVKRRTVRQQIKEAAHARAKEAERQPANSK